MRIDYPPPAVVGGAGFYGEGVMEKKLRIAVAAALAAAAALIAVWCVMRYAKRDDPIAEILRDGEVIRRVPLSEDCEFVVKCDSGENTITVANGEIRVSAADCPDKVCVRTGGISGGAVPIVCLPHRLEIRVVSADSEMDAVL